MEKTCKDCEHYEEHIKGEYVMYCNIRTYPIGYATTSIGGCSHHTPKSKPAETEEGSCSTCRFSSKYTGRPCRELFPEHYHRCDDFCSEWQSIPKPAEKIQQDYNARMDKIIIDSFTEAMNKPKPLKKAKENKMWQKLRKRGRRITMAWDLFGVLWLCKLANPWMYKFWHWVMPSSALTGDEIGVHVGHWILTIASIAAILSALYFLDRLAAWWYGEK